ncbi:MAG: hypothetical protein ABFR02_02180 [Campylobacterota bacterium]
MKIRQIVQITLLSLVTVVLISGCIRRPSVHSFRPHVEVTPTDIHSVEKTTVALNASTR